MKESFWAYFVVSFGLVIVVIMLFINNMTTTTEEDFYLTREIMQSSMLDAIDYGTYRSTGRLVMSEQKFVEVFLRRFAESVTNNKTYQISFYDIYEEPPKATVRVRTTAGASLKTETFDVNLDTMQSGILETIYGLGAVDEEESSEYTLTYASNGGSECTPRSITVQKGQAWGKQGALCIPTKEDYEFLEWNTKENGSGEAITDISIAKTDLTVYAQWKKLSNRKYIVNYSCNGGTGTIASHECVYEARCTLATNKCERTGYSFGGWKDNQEGNGNAISSGGNVIIENDLADNKITYYAYWTVNNYKLSRGFGDNLLANSDFETVSVVNAPSKTANDVTHTWDQSLNGIPGNTSKAYKAENWGTGANMNVALPELGYHAHFRKINNNYVLEYITNDEYVGKTENDVPDKKSVKPSANGIKADRWLGISQYINGETLVAGNSYIISADINRQNDSSIYVYGGPYFASTSSDGKRSFGASKFIFVPKSTGSWESHSWKFTLPTNYSDKTSLAIYVYATKSDLSSKTPGKLYLDNVSLFEVEKKSIDKVYGAKYTAEDLSDPSGKTGYSFDGWYNDVKFSKKLSTSDNFDTSTATFENVKVSGTGASIYSKWKPNEFTVAYNCNGGSGTKPSNQKCTYNQSCTLSQNTCTAPAGKVFDGWKQENKGDKLSPGASIKNAVTSGTVTYYAQWKNKSVLVRFNAGAPTSEVTFTSVKGDGWYMDDEGYVRKKDNSYHQMKVEYGEKFNGTGDLSDYNSGWMNFTRTGYVGKSGAEWIVGNTTFDQTATNVDYNKLATAGNCKATEVECVVVLKVNWVPTDVNYKVYHYLKDVGADTYTLQGKAETKTANAGSSVKLSDLKKTDITCAKYKNGSLSGGTSGPGTIATSATIAGDGSTKIYLFYDRPAAKLTLNKQTGISTVSGAGNYVCGQSVPIDATVATNYVWSTWAKTAGKSLSTYTAATKSQTIVMGKGDTTLEARPAKEKVSFTVKHYKKVVNDTTYTLISTETKTVDAGTTITLANYKTSYTGFSYYRGSTSGGTSGAGSAITTKKITSGSNITINLFYNQNKYKLTLSNDSGISDVSGAGTYEYGSPVTINATLKSGYKWNKWSKTSGTDPISFGASSKSQTIIMGNGKVTLKATSSKATCRCGTKGETKTYHYEDCMDEANCKDRCEHGFGQDYISGAC